MTIETPWEASIDWAPDFPRGSYVFDSHGNEIAGPIGGDEANLIAAAPDLLKALQSIVNFKSQTADDDSDLANAAFGKIMDRADDAIAKAKGK